jgi:hypothetical protein
MFCYRLVDGSKITGHAAEAGVQCGICSATAIQTAEDAAPIYDLVLAWGIGRNLVFPPVPLHLVDWKTLMADSAESNGHRALGTTRVTKTVCEGVTVKVDIQCITILHGLPRVLFGAVAAHEAGHAWLRASGIDGLSPLEEEGFCELLGFTWLREESSPESDFYAERIARNEDAVYGGGFRHVHDLSGVYGVAGVIDHLRMTQRLPQMKAPI